MAGVSPGVGVATAVGGMFVRATVGKAVGVGGARRKSALTIGGALIGGKGVAVGKVITGAAVETAVGGGGAAVWQAANDNNADTTRSHPVNEVRIR